MRGNGQQRRAMMRWHAWLDEGAMAGYGRRQEAGYKDTKRVFDSFQNHFKNFSQIGWKVSHTNKVQKLLLF
tara:strand:- start:144 stop:356 length:213 start_codon:yes stop_codon:yes gene_type:complete